MCFCSVRARAVHHRSYRQDVLEGTADDQLVAICSACHHYIHFDESGSKRTSDETDRILMSAQPLTDHPEPIVDLRRFPHRELPADWGRMNHLQLKGWQARYNELRRARRAELNALERARKDRRQKNPRDPADPWITLREGTDLWQEKGAPSNSYNWYRDSAMRSGHVFIGEAKVMAMKRGRVWCVEKANVLKAIEGHHERLALRKKVTEDYRVGVLHAGEGENVETDWGHYRRKGNFHIAFSEYARLRCRDDESILCNECFRAARHPVEDVKGLEVVVCPVCGKRRE